MTAEQSFPTPAFEARQGRVITQTITRPGTTFIAIVTLGDPTSPLNVATTPTPAPVPPPPPPPPPVVENTAPAPASSSSALSNAELGAILGSVLGFAFLVLIIWCCCSFRRRRAREMRRIYYYEDSEGMTESGTDETESFPGGVGRGGGGGGGFGMVYSSWPRRLDAGFTTVPPPAMIPPTPRYTSYRQTPYPQIPGVRRFP